MTAPEKVSLGNGPLTLADLDRAVQLRAPVELAAAAWERIAAARAVVDDLVERRIPAYGITTGVGSQKDFVVSQEELRDYNNRLIAAHGTLAPGLPASPDVVRAACLIQLNLFSAGQSGVRPQLAAVLVERLNLDDLPEVRLESSIGASDIVAMSQLGAHLIGRGLSSPGASAPLSELAAKEALSLMNSNALTLAQGSLCLIDARRLLGALDVAAALSAEGLRGNPGAWREVVSRAHPQPGEYACAAHLRRLLDGSALWTSGHSRFLQDPLSFRCAPQINGAAYAALDWAWTVWQTEINAPVDNPMIDVETGQSFSHGCMESTLLTLTLDALRLSLAKAVETSGERTHKLQWPAFSGLPTGLAEEGGAVGGVQFLNLGHITAAKVALVKMAAMPALPHYRGQVCDGVEDVGGMAPFAAAETERLLGAAWTAVTAEIITAVWAMSRRGIAEADMGAGTRVVYKAIRPLLPIGTEGERLFDIGPLVAAVKELAPDVDLPSVMTNPMQGALQQQKALPQSG